MRVNGLPNKFEIFQDYYYETNGEVISYGEALKLFSQMDNETKSEFEQYYKDETGYEIVGSGNGYNLDPDLGDIVCTKEKKKVKKKEKQKDGSIKWVEKEKYVYTTTKETGYNYVTDGSGNIVKDKNGLPVVDESAKNLNYVSQTQLNNIATKYTLEAYAKQNGLTMDPEWAQYSAEEIIQMENEGVNIPQDVIDMAHSIYEALNADSTEEDGETTEKEPFLNLIPEAKKKIEKCEENQEKISDKIDDMLPEKNKRQRKLENKLDQKLDALQEYEKNVREWRHLQNKVNHGEALTFNEAKRYAKIIGMLEDNNSKSSDFAIDKHEIAKSLNEMNILALLGEDLAVETIEIGEALADYTSKSNYKTTRKQVEGQIGFLRALSAMANGKTLAKEAVKVGNVTQDFTNETHNTIVDIAEVVGVENSLAEVNTQKPETVTPSIEEQAKIEEALTEDTVLDENSQEADPENVEAPAEVKEEINSPEVSAEEDVIINDETVKDLIGEAGKITVDLVKQTVSAVQASQNAKDDKAFATIAGKKIARIVKRQEQEENERQQEIKKLEDENRENSKEIENITGQSQEEIEDSMTSDKKDKESEDGLEESDKKKVRENKANISENNDKISEINTDSEESINQFKDETSKESSVLEKAIPEETKALEKDSEYKEKVIPEDKKQLNLTDASGETLAKMGTYRVLVGLEQIARLQIKRGVKNVAKGTISAGIGLGAIVIANTPVPPIAEKTTKSAIKNENRAIDSLGEVNTQIASVTGEEVATPATSASQEEGSTEGATVTTMADTNVEASVNDIENGNKTEAQTTQSSTTSYQKEEARQQSAPAQSAQAGQNAPVKGGALGMMIQASHSEKDRIKEIAKGDGKTTTTNKSKKGEKEELTTDKAQENVEDINGSAKDDSKDSVKVLDDTKKDEKQLDKEAKKIQKEMKKDQKDIIKMTKESEKAAKKQEELLAQYEAITAESEQLFNEEQQKKQNGTVQPTDNNGDTQQAGASNSFIMGTAETDNNDKLQENDQKITVLNGQFKILGRKIDRNTTKIKKLQKKTKTNQKKFNKKIKIRESKIKEAQEKEQAKQKRLAKQLGAVGVAENLFSITMSTGAILMAIPWSYAVGVVMFNIGFKGVLCCGLTKAVINMANGNWTAALMGLAQTAVTAALSMTGTGAAAGSVLGAVSAGLSIVSSSAEMVNNVRALQGKEASGVFSKIATIAGVASSLTNAAGSLKDIGKAANTFGKAVTIASVVGTAASSTSQLMSEFGGESKFANILGMVGSGLQLATSVMQLGQQLKNKEGTKTTTTETTNNNTTTNNNNTNNNNTTNNNTKTNNNTTTNNNTKNEVRKPAVVPLEKAPKPQTIPTNISTEKPKNLTLETPKINPTTPKTTTPNTNTTTPKTTTNNTTTNNNTNNGVRRPAVEPLKNAPKPSLLPTNINIEKPKDLKLETPNIPSTSKTSKLDKASKWLNAASGVMNIAGMLMAGFGKNSQDKKKGHVAQREFNKRMKEIKKRRLIQQKYASNYKYKKAQY